jgi:hypothetical protein
MGGLPKFRLEMARHQERVAQSSAAPRMHDALMALEPLNGRIAPIPVVEEAKAPNPKAAVRNVVNADRERKLQSVSRWPSAASSLASEAHCAIGLW